MEGPQGFERWCRQYGQLATEIVCPTCNRQSREQGLDHDVDGLSGI